MRTTGPTDVRNREYLAMFPGLRVPPPRVVKSSAHLPRGRSRLRLATLSNGNAAGLVHSSRFSFKSSNLRRDPKFWGLNFRAGQNSGKFAIKTASVAGLQLSRGTRSSFVSDENQFTRVAPL